MFSFFLLISYPFYRDNWSARFEWFCSMSQVHVSLSVALSDYLFVNIGTKQKPIFLFIFSNQEFCMSHCWVNNWIRKWYYLFVLNITIIDLSHVLIHNVLMKRIVSNAYADLQTQWLFCQKKKKKLNKIKSGKCVNSLIVKTNCFCIVFVYEFWLQK